MLEISIETAMPIFPALRTSVSRARCSGNSRDVWYASGTAIMVCCWYVTFSLYLTALQLKPRFHLKVVITRRIAKLQIPLCDSEHCSTPGTRIRPQYNVSSSHSMALTPSAGRSQRCGECLISSVPRCTVEVCAHLCPLIAGNRAMSEPLPSFAHTLRVDICRPSLQI